MQKEICVDNQLQLQALKSFQNAESFSSSFRPPFYNQDNYPCLTDQTEHFPKVPE